MEPRYTDVYANWFDNLVDIRARARILARIERLLLGNPGDVKPVGEGISEMRIDFAPRLSRVLQIVCITNGRIAN